MKQKSMYTVLLAILLSGCSSYEESGQENVEIKVGATVSGAVTKAPVTTGDSFTAAITAFEAAAWPSNWTTTPTWQNTITLVASETATGTSVPLNVSKVYPSSGNVYMAAWHPAIASQAGVVTFKQTGDEDVMYGGIATGSKTTPANAFSFNHALTQLNFQVQASDAYLTGNPGKKVAGIEVLSAAYPASMTIADGVIRYAAAADIAVPGVVATELSWNVTKIGEPLMVKAIDGLRVRVNYDDGTSSREIDIMDASTQANLKALAGYSHLITLSFLNNGEVGIEGTAIVAPWQMGATGNGVITPGI